MTIVGDGEQTRDYVHVSDVVEANVLAMKVENHGGEIFNIGTSERYSVLDVARMVGGDDAELTFLPQREGEARHTLASVTQSRESLLWKPKVNLKQWIKENR